MAARKAKRKYVKSRPKQRVRMVRLRVAPQLTPGEARQLQALTAEQKEKVEDRARDEVRSVSSLVGLLIVADLRRG